MNHTVEDKGNYDSIGFPILTISLMVEYYWKGLDLCGGAAPGIASALAIAMPH